MKKWLLPENTSDFFTDVDARVAVVNEVVHLGVVLAVRLDPPSTSASPTFFLEEIIILVK